MHSKNGFLLIELSVGLFLSIFFIIIITHYIIEAKQAQQKALQKIIDLSTQRNETERRITAQKHDSTIYV
jgi:hypothetical protein